MTSKSYTGTGTQGQTREKQEACKPADMVPAMRSLSVSPETETEKQPRDTVLAGRTPFKPPEITTANRGSFMIPFLKNRQRMSSPVNRLFKET